MSTVTVNYDGRGSLARVESQLVEVSGEPGQSFREALSTALGAPTDHGYTMTFRRVDEVNVVFICGVRPDTTLGQVAAFADGLTLNVDSVGRGGSHIEWLGDVVNTTLTVAGLLSLLGSGHDGYNAVRYRDQRKAAAVWTVAGRDTAPSLELVQMAKRERSWVLVDFEREFGLTKELAAELLRAVGYVQSEGKMPGWYDPKEESEDPPAER